MNKSLITLVIILLLTLIYFYYNEIKANILASLIIKRGILAPNCYWWKITEKMISDTNGLELYDSLKKYNQPFVKVNFLGQDTYVVIDPQYIKIILDQSPDIFGPGNLKYNLFKTFMPKNIGISSGCPWRLNRLNNENTLFSETLHPYYQHYHHLIEKLMKNNLPKNFGQFQTLAKKITMLIVFNDQYNNDDIFKYLSQANSLQAVAFSYSSINPTIHQSNINYYFDQIRSPKKFSLVELAVKSYTSQSNHINTNQINIDSVCNTIKNFGNIFDEIISQIPHWIFPVVGLTAVNVPRILTMLCNHPEVFKKLIDNINSIPNINDAKQIYDSKYLRYCILETLRLNNPVTTTFRLLLFDYQLAQYSFNKGDQFLILNGPFLRDSKAIQYPNRYIPERWNEQMEKSYYTLIFGQGPQRCPGKEFSILIIQLVLVNYFKYSNILNFGPQILKCSYKVDPLNIPQMFNPCNLHFSVDHI